MMRITLLYLVLAVFPGTVWAQLALSDLTIPDGNTIVMSFVGIAGTFQSEGNWVRVVWQPARATPIGSIDEGSTALTSDLSISALRCAHNRRCQLRKSGAASFPDYFEGVAPFDDGTWYYLDDNLAQVQLALAANAVSDDNVGSGFFEFDSSGGVVATQITERVWNLANGNRFILAFTRPASTTPTDNCNIYLGATDLAAPGELRLGALIPTRAYLGSNLVCGDAP